MQAIQAEDHGAPVGEHADGVAPEAETDVSARHDGGGLQGADRRWRELLAMDARLFAERGVRLLTPEARVLLYLRLEGSVPVTAAIQAAGTSYRGFYAVLDRLRQAGLVATVKDATDQRVKRLSLSPRAELAPETQP